MPDVAITELLEIDPDRVDAVSSPANGTEWLILKAIDDSETVADVEAVLAEVAKADADEDACDACDGEGLVKDTEAKCTKCRGTGIMPKVGMSEKELAEAAKEKGVAASGQPTVHATNCPTCKGTGSVPYGGKDQSECPDCDGTGKDSTAPPADKLARVDGDGHKIHVGDAKGREKVDKALDDSVCDDDHCEVCKEEFGDDLVEKKKLNASARNSLPDSAFALPGRKYPINDENHARNALARVAQNGTPEEQAKVKAAVHRKFPNIGESDASKAAGDTFTAPNSALAAMATKVGGDDSSGSDADPAAPGSPAWEAVDAQIAHDAALALKTASELIRQFAQREATEVAVGEGNDIFDTMEAESALCGVSHALGIMAQMAFHEGLEAAKSLDDADVVEKAGKRLSTKSVAALAAARDHISELLGNDDPAKSDKKDMTSGKSAADKFIDSANKALLSKEIDNMTADELIKLLDERDAQKAAEAAEKGTSAEVTADEVTIEVTDDTVEVTTEEATKAETEEVADAVELSPEEIEAKKARKDAKKALKAAQEAEKQAAVHAATAKAIEEAVTKATVAVDSLKEQLAEAKQATEDRLSTVEKMAAPSDIVRTRPVEALNKSAERDARDLEIAKFENLAKNTTELELRRGYLDRAKALRAELAEAKN